MRARSGKSKSGQNFYGRDFYLTGRGGSKSSAEVIVPIAIKLVQPTSVIDVGCGDGTWLSVFAEHGISDFIGIDGKWVDEKLLRISKEHFNIHDLTKPFRMKRRFDLVVSMEVAEHLPLQCAEVFVNTLVNLGSVVLFSAAIPLQGGTNHVNEQWPDYWIKLFSKRGYVLVDAIRKKVWQRPDVVYWYAQNTVMYVEKAFLSRYPLLETEYNSTYPDQISIVHPKLYLSKSEPRNMSLKIILKASPYILKNALIRHIRSLKRAL
jgi:SAM-dependent methyltransferase